MVKVTWLVMNQIPIDVPVTSAGASCGLCENANGSKAGDQSTCRDALAFAVAF